MGRQQEASEGERWGQQVSGRSRPRLARVGRGQVSQNLLSWRWKRPAQRAERSRARTERSTSAQGASPVRGEKRLDRGPRARVNDHTPGGAGLGPDRPWARARDECGVGGRPGNGWPRGTYEEDCRAFYCICKLAAGP